jgi:hypothetical protein
MSTPFNVPKMLVIKKYLEQQVYSDDDIITDRTNTVKLKVPGSGDVINSMVRVFYSYVEKFSFDETNYSDRIYIEFIKGLAEELGFEEKIAVNHFRARYLEMQKGEISDNSIFFMTAISSIIESFQQKVIKRLTLRLKRKIPSKNEEELQQSLEKLVQTSNTTFSLLINIEILKEMSRLLGVPIEPVITEKYQQEIISILKRI